MLLVEAELDELVVAKHTLLAEDLVDEADDVAVRAEVAVELACETPGALQLPHVPLVREVGAYVGPAEAVDALLGVAHGAEATVAVGEMRDEGDLQLACVLELVDHDEAETVAIAGLHLGQGLKRVERLGDEVVLVEHAHGELMLLIEALHLARKRVEAFARGRCQAHLAFCEESEKGLAEHISGELEAARRC